MKEANFSTTISMSNIRYSVLNGIQYPHVTSITQFYPKPWLISWQRAQGFEETDAKSETAMNFGKEANRLIDLDIFGKPYECENKRLRSCLNQAKAWREDLKIEAIETQKELFHSKELYCGTPDFYGKWKNKDIFADWKTGKNKSGESELQIGAYYGLFEANGILIKKGWLVYLEQDVSLRYGMIELKRLYQLFLKQFDLFKHYQKWEEKKWKPHLKSERQSRSKRI